MFLNLLEVWELLDIPRSAFLRPSRSRPSFGHSRLLEGPPNYLCFLMDCWHHAGNPRPWRNQTEVLHFFGCWHEPDPGAISDGYSGRAPLVPCRCSSPHLDGSRRVPALSLLANSVPSSSAASPASARHQAKSSCVEPPGPPHTAQSGLAI